MFWKLTTTLAQNPFIEKHPEIRNHPRKPPQTLLYKPTKSLLSSITENQTQRKKKEILKLKEKRKKKYVPFQSPSHPPPTSLDSGHRRNSATKILQRNMP